MCKYDNFSMIYTVITIKSFIINLMKLSNLKIDIFKNHSYHVFPQTFKFKQFVENTYAYNKRI